MVERDKSAGNVDLHKLWQQRMSRRQFLAFTGVAMLSLFGIFRVISELKSHAASLSNGFEPEIGTLASGAKVVTDTVASGGKAIQFSAATAALTRPTGAGYYPIESLGVPAGDLRAAIAKVPIGGTLTLPPGTWTLPDFDDPANTAGIKQWYALFCDRKGIVGSGPTTVITVVANTTTNVARGIIRFNSGSPQIGQFKLMGTPQQAVNPDTQQTVRWDYTGIIVAYCTKPVMSDLIIEGTQGSWNSPLYFKDATTYPAQGETGMLSVNRCTNPIFTRVELDGRIAGVQASGCGFGINTCSDIEMTDCYAHHTGYSHGYAFYRCKTVRTTGCGAEYCGQAGGAGSATAGTKGDGFNHEQTWDTYHTNPYSGYNSLAEARYYGNSDTPTGAPDTNMSNFGGNTYPHVVTGLSLKDGGAWDVRIDNLQTTQPTVVNGPPVHVV